MSISRGAGLPCLFKAGLLMKYAQERGAVELEPTDSASQKLLYVYRLLVHDKLIQPLPSSPGFAATRHGDRGGRCSSAQIILDT
jgi:hypothetical protein